jgi:hypothetical protein
MITFVVGLYKSGTSLVSSLLDEMGVPSIVDRVATTKGLTREYNIHESYFVNDLNNQILRQYSKGEIYFSNNDLPEDIDERYYQAIKQFYQEKGNNFFIKDPRFIGTLKYWLKCLPEDTDYKIIYIDRNEGLVDSFNIDKWFNDKVNSSTEEAINSLKSNYYQCQEQFEGIEIDFDELKKDKTALYLLLYNLITGDYKDYYKIYFHNYFLPSDQLTDLFKTQTPYNSGVWKNLIAIPTQEKADFEIIQDKTSGSPNLGKTLFFSREPNYVAKHRLPGAKLSFNHEEGETWLPQTWWVSKSYNDLSLDNNINKSKLLSIIDSGKIYTSFHKTRVEWIDQIVNSNIEVDVFGKTKRYQNNPKYKGELPLRDKQNGLLDYRFNLSIENGQTDFYFSEKFCDSILCNAFPIYYGCKQISKFFPEGSYFQIDPEQDIVKQVTSIINTPVEKLNYKALFEAKQLILEKYNIWDTIYSALNKQKLL